MGMPEHENAESASRTVNPERFEWRQAYTRLRRATLSRLHRLYLRRRRRWLDFDPADRSPFPLDVAIPLVAKDLPVFRECIHYLRKNLLHPIRKILIIAPDEPEIRAVCAELDCELIPETAIAPISKDTIRASLESLKTKYRIGWIYQQLLKLNVNTASDAPHILVLDADTAFVRPIRFEIGGKWIFDVTQGYEESYDDSLCKLLGIAAPLPYSFVVHHMVFASAELRSLHELISTRFQKPWAQAVFEALDPANELCLSEWNLYANFVLRKTPGRYTLGYWFNKEGLFDVRQPVRPQIEALAPGAKTVSMHHHKHVVKPPKPTEPPKS